MRRALLVSLVLSASTLLLGHEPPRAEAQDGAAINNAISKGIAGLKKLQGPGGIFPFMVQDSEKELGCTALCGFALLECEVPPTDQAIKDAANTIIRNAHKLRETYTIAFSIMFLDRYGGAAHSAVVRELGNKLLKGQTPQGDWGYTCDGGGGGGWTDNSNTQLAILGLWVARKHKVPVEAALKRTEQFFRKSQLEEGGWVYNGSQGGGQLSSPTMTCAGLLGLFLGFGQKKEKENEAILRAGKGGENKPDAPAAPAVKLDDIKSDLAVIKAMRIVGRYVGTNLQGVQHWLYLTWSIERVCVIYEFENVNGVNWYEWASALLVNSQRPDGTWQAEYGPAVDTAFALLVLKKSNVVGKIGETELRAAGGGKPPPVPGSKQGPGGKELGTTAKNEDEDRGKKLAQELVRASAQKQSQLIDDYKNAKGTDYTTALVEAIGSLTGGAKDKARLALSERFERMSSKQLAIYMEDANREMRQAAAIAAGRRGKDDIVPDLIKLLADRDSGVSQSAYDSLKSVSGKSFDKDAAAWEAWWKAKGSK